MGKKMKEPVIVFDIETTGLHETDLSGIELRCIAFDLASKPDEAAIMHYDGGRVLWTGPFRYQQVKDATLSKRYGSEVDPDFEKPLTREEAEELNALHALLTPSMSDTIRAGALVQRAILYGTEGIVGQPFAGLEPRTGKSPIQDVFRIPPRNPITRKGETK